MFELGRCEPISAQHAVELGLSLPYNLWEMQGGDEEPQDAPGGVVGPRFKCRAGDCERIRSENLQYESEGKSMNRKRRKFRQGRSYPTAPKAVRQNIPNLHLRPFGA